MARLVWVFLRERRRKEKKKAGGPEIFHLNSGVLCRWSSIFLRACVRIAWEVYLCMDRATRRVPVEGERRVDCEGWWLCDSYEQCLCPCPTPSPFHPPHPTLFTPPPPLFSGRPIARRVPGPSQPSFPHGKYLTLTVAHVCHITRRFRKEEKKKHCM